MYEDVWYPLHYFEWNWPVCMLCKYNLIVCLLLICQSVFESHQIQKKISKSYFFHNFHINTLHIMHTRCPIRNCGLVFISCIFRQLWMGISQTYQEIQSCHWHDNNWEIGEGTPNHWPSEHYSLFVALATFLAVWSWREWHHRTSSRDDLQPYGKAPIVASTLLMSRSHWHHGICMSLSCFGWLPIVREGKRDFFVQLWWYIIQYLGVLNRCLNFWESTSEAKGFCYIFGPKFWNRETLFT